MELQRLLRAAFKGENPNRTPAQVCDWVEPSDLTWDAVFDALVAHFTVYTHLRRLLIIRHLARGGPGTLEDLVSSIGMSQDAARRHLAKLHRRGLVRPRSEAPGHWELVRGGGPRLRRGLLNAFLRAIEQQGSKG